MAASPTPPTMVARLPVPRADSVSSRPIESQVSGLPPQCAAIASSYLALAPSASTVEMPNSTAPPPATEMPRMTRPRSLRCVAPVPPPPLSRCPPPVYESSLGTATGVVLPLASVVTLDFQDSKPSALASTSTGPGLTRMPSAH
jgi:hypothetical protein